MLCETRGAQVTAESLERCLLKPLGADLALCVSVGSELGPYDKLAKHRWFADEPEDWGIRFDGTSASSNWRTLAEKQKIHNSGLLGGSQSPLLVGSGGIIMWFRHFLRECLSEGGLLDELDWIAVVRSDYYWEFELPQVSTLDASKIYVLDGEKYGGVSDRFILFPKSRFYEILGIHEELFCPDSKSLLRMEAFIQATELPNPETYLRFQLEKFGLWDEVVWLPHNGWALRLPGQGTRWSFGSWSRALGVFVKYPDELKRSLFFRLLRGRGKHSRLNQGWAPWIVRIFEKINRFIPRGVYFAIRRLIGPPLKLDK